MNIIWYDNIDSTNVLAGRSLEDLKEGEQLLIAAIEQSSGRGQGTHSWHSEPGKNLTFTIAVKYPKDNAPLVSEEARISYATALGILDYLASNNIRAKIKLPNDIYVDDNKICGLLIKHQVKGERLLNSIIGIGLNVNETLFPPELPNPISMKNITGEDYCIKDELEKLANILQERLSLSVSLRSLENEFKSNLVEWQK